MFRTIPATATPDVPAVADTIPLSVLQLDIEQPGDGWTVFLAGRGIEVLTDDIGRPSIARDDAKQLHFERREAEARRAEFLARADEAAIEFDRARRAELFAGIPAAAFGDVAPAAAMLAAAKDAQPKRRTLLHEALTGSQMTFHPINEGDE
jgi:hypothetical protein